MDPSHKAWERMSIDEMRRLLAVRLEAGLSHEEAKRRLDLYGLNQIAREEKAGIFSVVGRQFKNPLAIVLVFAGVTTFILGEYLDSSVIFIALAINVIVGSFQEERASRAFESLNASQERRAIVLREGKRENIPATHVVPGDIVFIEGGYIIPADARVIEEKDLRLNESALTGEWLAVAKRATTLEHETPLAEQENMVWMGTLIEAGYGTGVVVATGSRTQMGAIAQSLSNMEEQITPLQKNIRAIVRYVSFLVAGIIASVLLVGLARGESLHDMLFVSIAVAVAAMPTGLPAALTVVLAIGMETILKRGGLVRNLIAAETLGSTTVILTDKTGTLTEAHMKLTGLYSYEGIMDGREVVYGDNRFLLEMGIVASDAFIEEGEDAPNKLTVHGRPIEKALLLAGLEIGIVPDLLLKEYPRLSRLKFSSERRFGASLHDNPHKQTNRLILSGEPETLLNASVFVRHKGKRDKITDAIRKEFEETLHANTSQGKRLIGIAYRDASFTEIPEEGEEAENILKQLIFAGFVALEDPVRTDVPAAIAEVREAGAQVIMLTGDNPETARHIAGKVGIVKPGDELVIRGAEIDAWNDAELYAQLQTTRVIARATPAHKLRIANILKRNGEVVAMTGDGINDAPALRMASIGVAVGSGTEVAKESSDLILIDNSFSVIVAAIEEGRRIIDNLKKIVSYLLSTSFSSLMLITGSLVLGSPIPLTPVQILWANIVGGDLISFAYAFEKRDPNAMKRDPRSARAQNILTREIKTLTLTLALISGTTLVILYQARLAFDVPMEKIRTILFVALSLDAFFYSISLKSLTSPIWRINPLTNPYLLGAVGFGVVLLLSALTFVPLQKLLSLVHLAPIEILLLVGLGLFNLNNIELAKYFLFRRGIQSPTKPVAASA
jgi:Ca2+-transporting ATPase